MKRFVGMAVLMLAVDFGSAATAEPTANISAAITTNLFITAPPGDVGAVTIAFSSRTTPHKHLLFSSPPAKG